MSEQSWSKRLSDFFMPKTSLPMAGAQLWFQEGDTSSNVPVGTFADEELQIPNTHPVVADVDGNFPPIFLNMAKPCSGILKDHKGRWLFATTDARSWCGPIPSNTELSRLRSIEQAAREVLATASNTQGEGRTLADLDRFRVAMEQLGAALEKP